MNLRLHPTLPNHLRCWRCDAIVEIPAGPLDAQVMFAIIGGLEAKHRICEPAPRFTLTDAGRAYESAYHAVKGN